MRDVDVKAYGTLPPPPHPRDRRLDVTRMLITLCYVYLWLRSQKFHTLVIRSAVRRLSGGGVGVAFCKVNRPSLPAGPSVTGRSVLLRRADRVVYVTEPQACDDFSRWNLMLGSSLVQGPRKTGNVAFVIEATADPGPSLKSVPTAGNVLKWSDYCLPLACSPGRPFRAVAEASVDNFSRLGVAFMEDRLRMDNGLMPEKIVSVLLQESSVKELVESTKLNRENQAESVSGDTPEDRAPSGSPSRGSEGRANAREAGQDGLQNPGVMEGGDHHTEDLHLHLSSCHECLELENSTILSVKFASAENIPDLPDDYDGDEAGDDGRSLVGRNGKFNHKPPNLLVYTGGCQERFEHVRALLAECVDTDSYALYPLRPQQVLTEPWLNNAALLVLAEQEPLTPQLQERFMAYLEQGGKVLGLSSCFCPGGLSLTPGEALPNSVCRLCFARANCTEVELSVLAGGRVFVHGETPVELWGELRGDSRATVIARVMHGNEGGEAVLCQVRLETAPSARDVSNLRDFDELKASNPLRYEVLSEILRSLGLRCEPSQAPPPSPVFVLSTSEECTNSFLRWLQRHVEEGGLLRTPTVSLKVVPGVEPPTELPEGVLALVTRPPDRPSENFSLQTYRLHLHTRTLGRCVLFAETVPTTMDLLEGLMLQLPQEVGLIAVATRQTQGRGRAGNAWLSPPGCAMFTAHVCVAVSSRLGQRIPFLQHLAALAIVEAVRTLPGYEDIDLTVKWPNDIYYSNLVKLGGVLVNSTLMGATFHLLVGCGFNVSNSNPTICINDLVEWHNRERGSSLEPLSPSQLIARSITLLEGLIASFEDGGPPAVLPLYYKRWLHSGTQVRLQSEDGPLVEVVGLDDNGFLQVHSGEQGVVSVQPDGNSFDMLRNLIVTKQH